jgi:hypothetical protein
MRPPSACTAFVTLRCLAHMPGHGQAPTQRLQPAFDVRRNATRDHQAHAAAGALRKVGGQLVEIAGAIFQAGMHGTHQHPVGQGHVAKVERGKQVWVAHGCLQFKRLYEDARKRVV